MVQTVEKSLRSILNNTTDEFEILVVDDGSTDGSADVIDRLSREHERLRVVPGENRSIAEARNCSIQESRGELIIHQLDTDDWYEEGIIDFVRLYESLSVEVERDVYLRGNDIHVASRDLLRRIPYRNVGYGEDLDLWRRMDADPDVEMIWLRQNSICEKIGYERGLVDYARVRYSTAKVQFQSGITPTSYIRNMISELRPWGQRTRPRYGALFHILITPLAYFDSLVQGHLNNDSIPRRYRDYQWYMNHILTETVTAAELIQKYELNVDAADFSNEGQQMLFGEPLPSPEETVP